MFKIIENCISKNIQNNIKKTMFGSQRIFPWYFAEDVTFKKGKQKRPALFHEFVLKKYKTNSDFLDIVKPIVKNKNIIRAKAILQLPLNKKTFDKKFDSPHVDFKEPHLVYLYYVINSDGCTLFFKNKKVIKKIKPKQGRLVIFNGNIYHTAQQPEKGKRCIINFNVDI
jgi:hypothetical protein|tara:strand:+ start:617 stop:1123 length:507 start_codon:yes stop_codon:yes gene_type:complete